MADIKHEPLEVEDQAGKESVGIGCASGLTVMESSAPTSACPMTRIDLIADNSGTNGQEQNQRLAADGVKLGLMHTEEDPLLQETINALMNGTGGIEAVAGSGTADEIDSERNYECNFCGKLFTRSNTLSYHLKVHNDEKPYKCGSCDKAFREQYRLTKHQKTHARDFPGNVQQDQEAEHSQDSSFPSTSGRTGEEEDYTTGDSERFFRSYDLQESNAAMKLEPDISLTVDGASTNPPTQSSSDNDVRYQIVEERIKSLQREVHLVNQNLNRVETKLDGLTKIIALFINKFEGSDTHGLAPNNNNVMIPIPLLPVPIENHSTIQPQAVPITVSLPPPPQTQSAQPLQMIPHHPTPMVSVPVQPTQATSGKSQPYESTPSSGVSTTTTFIGTGCSNITSNGSALQNNNDTFPEIPELPIRTVNDFLDLNDHCTDNEQFLLQMMIRLHQEVDNSQPHQRNVKKMMEALVTYEVLCQFSWSGKSAINGQYTKYVFGNSVGIIDLLTKTLNLGRSDEEAEANQKLIFTAIQSFIKHSRQNMLRDSRKRRESSNGFYNTSAAAQSGCSIDRYMKQIKSERHEAGFNQF
ncbi:serendipity locus protein H-1-like [Toxorhynchites rutilus septentrionalis]|uniref:serendipity locus protein H-1-like n=1 Tax=Toxorhynchites rutilus septentrionalis TaxID=329112 RepID=UPI00247A1432|nr:serendipity locus protein H-1-like [Toxorhynchites rutilus septentrionalis]